LTKQDNRSVYKQDDHPVLEADMDHPSNATSRHMASPVVELRQYTLHPGQRETLIGLFDNEFIESQEATGMTVIGQFRDLDRPDMFVWMRGFEDMEARREALTAFYDGPVWARHRDAANGTMIDSNDVLLLKPAWRDAGFSLSKSRRPPTAGVETSPHDGHLASIVEISIHHLRPGIECGFAEHFQTKAIPQLEASGARLLGAFTTKHVENTFPRLPVRTGENVFISVVALKNQAAHFRYRTELAASPAWLAIRKAWKSSLTRPDQVLRLSPTSQSLVRQ